MRLRAKSLMVIFFMLTASTLHASEELKQMFMDGTPMLDMRYRYEFVDQDGLANNADASTLRTRLGYKTAAFHDFTALVEFENVAHIGDDNYNDTVNGKTDHPVVADVEGTEVNQAFLEYTGISDTNLKGGRQVIALDGHRFIGHVGWRQNNQTFDAATFTNKSIPDTTVKYGFIGNVNRIFGEDSPAGDWESESHFVNVSNTTMPLGTITGYAYWLDFKSDSPANSNETYGGSLKGKLPLSEDITFKYHAEYAYQSEFGDNTTNYDADYYHLAPAISALGLTATVGYEVLGSDSGAFAFRTPLATGHKFNGWSDKFLTTPAAGLEDVYVDLTYKVKGMEGDMEFLNGFLAKFQYHDFQSEEGSSDYGSEWGLYAKQPINKNMYVEAKYSDYDADAFATDTQKFTFGFGIKY